jgi:hypothetical protein
VIIPRGANDPHITGGTPWPQWEHRRLGEIFRARCITMAEARAQGEERKAERVAWLERWRKVQRNWAKWMRWRQQIPQEADRYRQQHQDTDGGDEKWLLEFGSLRLPRAPGDRKPRPKNPNAGETYERESESIAESGTSTI